jgi:hypothetical protein
MYIIVFVFKIYKQSTSFIYIGDTFYIGNTHKCCKRSEGIELIELARHYRDKLGMLGVKSSILISLVEVLSAILDN